MVDSGWCISWVTYQNDYRVQHQRRFGIDGSVPKCKVLRIYGRAN